MPASRTRAPRHHAAAPHPPWEEPHRALDQQVAALMDRQCAAPQQWAAIDDSLARYSLPVLYSWFADRTVSLRVYRLTGQSLRLHTQLAADRDAVTEIIGTTVAVSLRRFRRGALAGTGWQPHHRASARTYFVGRCLLELPTEYHRFCREYLAPGTQLVPLRHAEQLPSSDPFSRPEDLALAQIITTSVLNSADPRTRHALLGVMYGYPLDDIATAMGTTTKAVEMLLYRYRRRLRLTQPTTALPREAPGPHLCRRGHGPRQPAHRQGA